MSTPSQKQTPDKCAADTCTKKTGLISFTCRCNLVFCTNHRLPEKHNCSFNYVCQGKELLSQKLLPVVLEKIIKIN